MYYHHAALANVIDFSPVWEELKPRRWSKNPSPRTNGRPSLFETSKQYIFFLFSWSFIMGLKKERQRVRYSINRRDGAGFGWRMTTYFNSTVEERMKQWFCWSHEGWTDGDYILLSVVDTLLYGITQHAQTHPHLDTHMHTHTHIYIYVVSVSIWYLSGDVQNFHTWIIKTVDTHTHTHTGITLWLKFKFLFYIRSLFQMF